MKTSTAFNKQISTMVEGDPSSSASKLIKWVMNEFGGNTKNYYPVFDEVSFKLGIGIIAGSVVGKNYEATGYIPCIKYYPENLVGEESKTVELLGPMSLTECYTYMAKELVYRLMRVSQLKSLLTSVK